MRKIEEIRQELKGKKLLVVPYMHADWAWCHTHEWHARRYVAVFEDVIEVLKKNIGYKWYMDCFCTEMGPLLERRPELIAQLRPFVDSGDIQIAGGFFNVRPNMVGDEAYIRNMIIGRKRFEEHFPGTEMIVRGEGVDTALGHPQIPQLITKGGYRYLRAGQQEKAESLIRSLPHIWESREILMPEVYSNEEYTEELKKCIIKVLSFLCQKIDATTKRQFGVTPAYIQLGVDFTPKASTAELLTEIKNFLET